MAVGTSQSQFAFAQSGSCSESGPSSGAYTIRLCINSPSDGDTITGVTTVVPNISWGGGPHPVVSKLIVYLGNEYVLTAFEPPFHFDLPSQYYIDGTRSFSVTGILSDGFVTDPVLMNLTLANGTTQTPTNDTPFNPYVPPGSGPLIVAATGDGASAETPEVTNLIATWNPDLFLYLGDVYEKGTYPEFYNWYGGATTYFGQFRSITNPVIGNHEYENGVAPGYFYYWGQIPNYYSYDAGGWHFIALNSTSEANQTAPGSPQYQWLANDLATNTALCTIAYFHHPRYNIGPEGEATRMSYMWDLMALNGVDVVLTGHDHNYQRWTALDLNGNPKSDGITQFVAGGGGHGIQGFIRTDSRLQLGVDTAPEAFGALKLQLNSSSMDFQYINAAGDLLDSGTVPCHPPPVDTTPPTPPTNLTATITSVAHVYLQWGAATDDTRVNGYTIYRDGSLLATVSAQTLNYTDTTTASNTAYTYTVDAYDLNNSHSALSNPVSITTPKITTLTLPITADSYVNNSSPSSNFGNSPFLRVDLSPLQRSYLRFNVPDLPGNVFTATLQVYTTTSNVTGYTVYNTSGGWGETTINFSNAPALGSSLGSSGPFSANSWTTVDVTPLVTGSGQYNIVLATISNTAASLYSRTGTYPPMVIVRVAGIPPDNDNFANSVNISSLPYSNPQSNESATLENLEQAASCEGSANIRNTVWYNYTATADQRVTFSVTGSNVVKGISVWTGSALGSLTQVGCGTPSTNAAVRLDTTNGTPYFIRIGTSNGVADTNFTVQAGVPPANDDFANAIAINTGFAPFSDAQDVTGANFETGDPIATCGTTALDTIWYKYISLGRNVLSLNTVGSDYDTVLSVWTGGGLGGLTQIGCNDNNGALTTSALTVNTIADVTYFIRVSSKGGGISHLTFNASAASTAGVAPLRNYFTTPTPTLTWNRVVGATQYEVQVSDTSTFTVLVYPAVIVPASQLSVTTNPLPEGVYYWRVRAITGAVVGSFSPADSFVVDLP